MSTTRRTLAHKDLPGDGAPNVATSVPMAGKKRNLPKHVFKRGNKLWYTMPDADGVWKNRPTPFTVDQVTQCEQWMRALTRGAKIRRDREERGEAPMDTFRAYAAQWLKDREAREIVTIEIDRSRLDKFILPVFGDLRLEEIRPHHARDFVRALKARRDKKDANGKLIEKKMANRSILHVFGLLHNVMESVVVDEHVSENPIRVKEGELPKKVDSDPEWRDNATYTIEEVEDLISNPIIPAQRRVQYAFKALAGMRHGEVAALCVRHINFDVAPLARINIGQAYSTTIRAVKETKTEETRKVPMHPALTAIVKVWLEVHWERVYGRKPGPDDFVVPTLALTCVDCSDAAHALRYDLEALQLRTKAGRKRHRGGHDLRSFYKTQLIEDGADSLIVRRTTHAPPKDVDGGYERFSWAVLCREISKLNVTILDGGPLKLLTDSLQEDVTNGTRWRKRVTPLGIEPSATKSSARAQNLLPDDESEIPQRAIDHSRTSVRKQLLTAARMLDRALRLGDTPRALRVVSELRALGAIGTAAADRGTD